ncbi:unnamed protein product [Cylindrotheca closterium]|uniref:G-protein coupled receptors family 3 profile domain-containing protein n=1 Tax=Cylindrotheca closterium TaxID=2856 RepID=A0AAD2CPY5_9STRA|nr:unnamed protein product [Cylindrotheca closterium]
MTGLNLWKMTNYSVSSSSFSYANTVEGGNLQQVSGLKVTYNTELDASTGKLVKLEVWNATQNAYVPVERLQVYKFATNSYNCCCNAPFNAMATSNLNIPGEVPGRTLPYLEQEAVADFLSQLNGTYSGELQGRLTNDTTALANLDLSQSQEDCLEGLQYWSSAYQTCFNCPNIDNIVSVWERNEPLTGASGQMDDLILRASIINEEDFGVALSVESMPSFLSCSGQNDEVSRFCQGIDAFRLQAGGQLNLDFAASFEDLQAGIVQAVVVIGVADSGNFPGCRGNGVNLDIELQVLPTEELNQLGNIRIVGFCLAALISFSAMGFACWCLIHRQNQSVKLMQPLFLVTLCVGILAGGLSLIPMSIDDEIASEESADIACMAFVWLISLGFSIAFAALYAKLKRVNTIVSNAANFRRIQVKERDVLAPMALLFLANFIVLLTSSFVDPLRYERDSIAGQPWNTYGSCRNSGTDGEVLMWLLFAINAIALATACWEAYKARNVSKELSEASRIGMAIFSWMQIGLIGFPVILLLDKTNTIIVYFIKICLVFFSSMSLLLWVFVPLVWKGEEAESLNTRSTRHGMSSRINHSGAISRISAEAY